MVYTEDVKGNEIYTAHVINVETREPIEKPLVSVASNVEWAGDDALLYLTKDETLREYKVLALNFVLTSAQAMLLFSPEFFYQNCKLLFILNVNSIVFVPVNSFTLC